MKSAGIGNGYIGSGSKTAIGRGIIKSENGPRPNGFLEGTVMERAKFDRQMQRAIEKRMKKEEKANKN